MTETVEFTRQGNVNICALWDEMSEKFFYGAAICNRDDSYNEAIGRRISFGRAAAARANYYAEYAFAR